MSNHDTAIAQLRAFPAALRRIIDPLTPEQLLATPINGEWSIAQNIHHLADSHMHSYLRCKRIVAEEFPLLTPYDQDIWAGMDDAMLADYSASLQVLTGLHERWAVFFASLSEAQWQRAGFHPEVGEMTLEFILDIYVTHGLGHIDQILRNLAAL